MRGALLTKHLIIGTFLFSLVLALWFFFARSTKSLRENMENAPSHSKPRVVLEEFTLRRYNKGSQESELHALYADFRAPNKVELQEEIGGWQEKGSSKQTFTAGKVIAFFDSDTLTSLMENAELDTAIMRKFVRISYLDHKLLTDEAHYSRAADKITSDQPVSIEGPNRWFTGQDGFRLFLEDEVLDVYGRVRGMVRPNEKSNNND